MINASEASEKVQELMIQESEVALTFVEEEINKAIIAKKFSITLIDFVLPELAKNKLEALGYIVTTCIWAVSNEKCTIISWNKN